MSKAPSADTQPLRDPVATCVLLTLAVLQSVVPLSGPGSGVPATANCHSAFDGSRLRELPHACCAWNHVTHAVGCTPGIDTAYSGSVHCPLAGKVSGNAGVQLNDGL